MSTVRQVSAGNRSQCKLIPDGYTGPSKTFILYGLISFGKFDGQVVFCDTLPMAWPKVWISQYERAPRKRQPKPVAYFAVLSQEQTGLPTESAVPRVYEETDDSIGSAIASVVAMGTQFRWNIGGRLELKGRHVYSSVLGTVHMHRTRQ